MKPLIATLSIILLLFSATLAQNSRRLEKAQQFYNAGEYTKALKLYIKLFNKASSRQEQGELAFKIGLIARKLNNPQLEYSWFRAAYFYKYQNPLVYLYLADAYKMRGAYQAAEDLYKKYKQLVPNDPRADLGIESCELAQKWMNKPTRFSVQFVPRINSRYDDFAPALGSDTTVMYFTSCRPSSKGKKINPSTGTNFADIYVSFEDKKGVWSVPKPIKGDVNTEQDEGSCYISPDGTTMYYTRCVSKKDANIGCKIFVAQYQNGQWVTTKELHFFSDSSVSVGQPYLTDDQLTIYFVVRNNPQNIGGSDIWYATRPSKLANWGPPMHLGPEINTKEDELFPSVDHQGNLYFASRGHITMGGFDIFKATKLKNGHWKVTNMKYPINSYGDDFRITFISDSKGYLSSNRFYRNGDDIFYFWQKPIKILLAGSIINDKTKIGVEYATVTIEGSNGRQYQVTTDYDGNFKIQVAPNTDYFIIAEKEGFLKGKTSFTTRNIKNDTTLHIQLFIQPYNQIVKIPDIRYFFNDTTLRPESKVALDKLIDLLKLNPDIKIEIMAHTDYRGSTQYNLRLSQGRANSVVDYLVKHGISKDRLVAKGYGESKPFVVDKETAKKYPFLKVGQVLSQQFIESLPKDEQEICNELNRRTEFRVIGKIHHYEKFGATPVTDTTDTSQTEQY